MIKLVDDALYRTADHINGKNKKDSDDNDYGEERRDLLTWKWS